MRKDIEASGRDGFLDSSNSGFAPSPVLVGGEVDARASQFLQPGLDRGDGSGGGADDVSDFVHGEVFSVKGRLGIGGLLQDLEDFVRVLLFDGNAQLDLIGGVGTFALGPLINLMAGGQSKW